MGAAVRELEVIARTLDPEQHAVETVMALEASDNAKAQATAVHGRDPCDITDGPGNPEVGRHGDAGFMKKPD
jgi:hypothetical protein